MPVDATISIGGETSQLEADISRSLKSIERNSNIKLNFDSRSYTEPLGRITGAANEFSKSLNASNARVLAFGASAGIIYTVGKAFDSLISSTINVQKALTDINVILNSSGENLDKFKNQLFDIAKITGQSFATVAEAAVGLARQGLGAEETLKRTRDALILTRISGASLQESLESLTAGINSFNKSALDSTQIINKLSNVDTSFAVSARDLAEAIKRVGSAAQDAGINIDQLIALVTAAQVATGRGGAVIASAFNTIFTRIQRPEILNQLDELGVKIKDLNGNTLPTIQILSNLAKAVDSVGTTQGKKANLEELVGGVRQLNILKATLTDLNKEYSVYSGAVQKSLEATDQAIDRNNRLNDTYKALANRVSVNATQAASKIGDLTVGPLLSTILGDINSSLESINGQTTNSSGAKIGEGILKGISDYITGPGLLLVGVAVGGLLLNFAKFAQESVKQLITISQGQKERLALEHDISSVLSRQPEIEKLILDGTLTQIDAERTYLSILNQQASVKEKLASLSSSTAESIIAQNLAGVKVDSNGSRISPNPIRNFSPLDDAFNREVLLGASPATIRVGKDSRLKNGDNPLGVGVYNTNDEPYGLAQGVDRVLGSTKNIPNFALPLEVDSLTNSKLAPTLLSIAQSLFARLQESVKSGELNFEEASNKAKLLAEQTSLSADSAIRMQSSLRALSQYYENAVEKAASIKDNTALFRGPPNTETGLIPVSQPSLNNGINILPSSGKVTPLQDASIDVESYIQKQLTYNNTKLLGQGNKGIFNLPNTLSPSSKLDYLTSNIKNTSDIQPTNLPAFNEKLDYITSNLRAKVGSPRVNNFSPAYSIANAPLGPDPSLFYRETTPLGPDPRLFQDFATKSFSSFIPGTRNNQIANNYRNSNNPGFTAARNQFNQSIQTKAIGFSLAAPIVSEVASQFIPDDSRGGRGARSVVNGLGSIASYAGVGAAVGLGVPGAIGGAALGLALQLPTIIKSFTSEIPEFSKAVDDSREKLTRFREGVRDYATALENYSDAISKSGNNITPQELLKRQGNVQEALLKVPEEFRAQIAAAAGDAEKLKDALGETQKSLEKTLQVQTINKNIEQLVTDKGGNVFDNNETLKSLASQIFTNGNLKNLNGANGKDILNNLNTSAFGTLSGGRDNFNNVLNSQLGVSPTITKELNKLSTEDSQKLALAIAEVGRQFSNTEKYTSLMTSAIKESQNEITKTSNAIKDLNKQFEAGLISLVDASDIAKNATINFLQIQSSQQSFQRNELIDKAKSSITAAEPFLTPETKASSESALKIQEIQAKTLDQISKEILASQEKFTSLISKQIDKPAQKIGDLAFSTESENPSLKDAIATGKSRDALEKLIPVFSEFLKNVSENPNSGSPKSISDLFEKIRQTGASDSEISLLISATEKIGNDSKNSLSKIIEQNKEDTQIAKNQLDAQLRLIAQQQRLSFGGGAQDFLSGSGITDKLVGLVNERIANTFSSPENRQESVGRTSFRIASTLKSSFNISGNDLPDFLKSDSLNGLITNLNSKINIAEQATLARVPEEQRKGVTDQFSVLRTKVPTIAQDQLNNELKTENLSTNVEQLKNDLKAIRELNVNQAAILQTANQKAFTDALKDVQLDLTNDKIEEVTRAILNINKISKTTDLQEQIGTAEKTLRGAKSELPITLSQQDQTVSELKDFIKQTKTLLSKNSETIPNPNNLLNQLNEINSKINENPQLAIKDFSEFLKSNTLTTTGKEGLAGEVRGPLSLSIESKTSGFVPENFISQFNNQNLSSKLEVIALSINQETESIKTAQKQLEEKNKALEDFTQNFNKTLNQSGLLPKSSNRTSSQSSGTINDLATDFSFKPKEGFFSTLPINQSLNKNVANKQINDVVKTINDSTSSNKAGDKNNLLGVSKDETLTRLNEQLSTAKGNLDELVNSGTAFAHQIQSAKQAIIDLSIQAGKVKFGGADKDTFGFGANPGKDEQNISTVARESFQSNFTFGANDQLKEIADTGKEVGATLKSSFAEAFKEFSTGSKSALDSLKGIGIAIGTTLLNKSIDFGTNSLFSSLFGSSNSLFSSIFSSANQKNAGGLIKGYAYGGKVAGGSGVVDDVPAMLSQGEYVVKRSSVNKYGTNLLDKLNNGGVIGFDSGGSTNVLLGNSFDYSDFRGYHGKPNDPLSPTKGAFNVSSLLSNFGASDENSVQNKLKFQREQTFNEYQKGFYDYNLQKDYANDAFENSQDQRVIGAGISAAFGVAGSEIGSAFTPTPPSSSINNGFISTPNGSYYVGNQLGNTSYGPGYSIGQANGGFIRGYAKGGNVDNIPALLTGGEYVMNQRSVDAHGVEFFNQLNNGTLPSKFATGGLVGKDFSSTSSNPEDSSTSEIIKFLSTISDDIKKGVEAQTKTKTGNNTTTNSQTNQPIATPSNQFTITINIGDKGNVSSQTDSSSSGSGDTNSISDPTNSRKFADSIQALLVKFVTQQQRPGGLLYNPNQSNS